jgi:hypothetical protein
MPGLVKATLADASKPKDTAIEVQLNPTSLRLQMANSVDGGRSRGRQVQQYQATSSTTLSMDLVFDTADEGTTGTARSVREKTAEVARFVLPAKKGSKQVPPRVRFTWGEFVLEGVMTSLTEDIDLFSAEGVPLRAKVSISISGQDPNFANLATGAGANQGANATNPGGQSTGPGSSGTGAPDRTALALGGESAAEFAARVGLDPAGWRGVTAGLEGSLSLEAGAQIDFSADVSVSTGIGVSVGVEAGASASAEVALGLAPAGGTTDRGAGATSLAGFALSAAGGVAAAAATVATGRADAAASGARQAFGTSAPRAARARTDAERPVASDGGGPAAGRDGPDPRAASFGFGVPLRPRVRGAAADRLARVQGAGRLAARAPSDGGPVTTDPTVPPWLALPLADRVRRVADRVQGEHRPSSRCGCGERPSVGARCGTCGGLR